MARRTRPDIGRRLRTARKRAKLTQEALARRAHVSAKSISSIENDRSDPSYSSVVRIVEVGLGVPLVAFLGADVEATRDDLARLNALLAAMPATKRRLALRLMRALAED